MSQKIKSHQEQSMKLPFPDEDEKFESSVSFRLKILLEPRDFLKEKGVKLVVYLTHVKEAKIRKTPESFVTLGFSDFEPTLWHATRPKIGLLIINVMLIGETFFQGVIKPIDLTLENDEIEVHIIQNNFDILVK
jgi:hypothetical protein